MLDAIPTNGFLLVTSTKPTMLDLTKQFVERRVKKTYAAIISTNEALSLGVDVNQRMIVNGS